uniref:Uncharacterized protein n=1 Tax=Lepeophtheirus salmonis TaxID=72036 RepID=A0A0K2UEX4_LEPSM
MRLREGTIKKTLKEDIYLRHLKADPAVSKKNKRCTKCCHFDLLPRLFSTYLTTSGRASLKKSPILLLIPI